MLLSGYTIEVSMLALTLEHRELVLDMQPSNGLAYHNYSIQAPFELLTDQEPGQPC